MAQGRIEIQFKPKGDKALIGAIKQLDIATKRLQGTTSVYEKELKQLELQQRKFNKQGALGVRNLRNMDKASNRLLPRLSVLRSKLLIVSFALAIVGTAFKKVFDKMIIQEQAEKKLEVALGKVNKQLLNQASALQKVTTFGDEAIIEVQALIGSFAKDEEAIKKATKATLDLAAAKGMDLKTAGDLVSKTLGSSTNSLSRYGIEVAGAVGSTQRLESLTQNIATLFGGQAAAAADTLGGRVEQMNNAFGDANESLGKAFAPTIMKISKFFKETAEAASEFLLTFSETPLERTIRQLGEMGEDTKDLQVTLLSIKNIEAFNAMEIPLNNIAKLEEDIAKTTARIGIDNDIIGISLNQQGKEYQKLLKEGYKVEDLQKAIRDEVVFTGTSGKAQTVHTADWARELLKGYNLAVKNQESATESSKIDAERLLKLLEMQATIAEINELLGFGKDDGKDMMGMTADEWGTLSNNVSRWSGAVLDIANSYNQQRQASLNAQKATALGATESIKSERVRAKKIEEINERFAEKQKAINKEARKTKRAQTVVNTSVAIMEALADKSITSMFSKWAMVALIGIQGAMQLKAIDAQKYAQGGYVGGRSHSQGGTMIEAERGEYVVSRRGVDAIGLEALNRINAGAGGGSVNISFSGNILSKDFLEDEAIPQIKEALRRGGDIGVG